MAKYQSVYIREAGTNWIIKILCDDIYQGLDQLGYKCRKGNYEDYQGEEVTFSMWWRYAQPYKDAKLNGVFITHTDDVVKEYDLVRMKDELIAHLKEKEIDTRLLFTGMHKQNSMKAYGCDCSGKYPVCDWLTTNGFYLPSGSGLTESQISFICDTIKKF